MIHEASHGKTRQVAFHNVIPSPNVGLVHHRRYTESWFSAAPPIPGELWAEAFRTSVYLKNSTLTEILGGKASLEV